MYGPWPADPLVRWTAARDDLRVARQTLRWAPPGIARQAAYTQMVHARELAVETMHAWLATAVGAASVERPERVVVLGDRILFDEGSDIAAVSLAAAIALRVLQLAGIGVVVTTGASAHTVQTLVARFGLLAGIAEYGVPASSMSVRSWSERRSGSSFRACDKRFGQTPRSCSRQTARTLFEPPGSSTDVPFRSAVPKAVVSSNDCASPISGYASHPSIRTSSQATPLERRISQPCSAAFSRPDCHWLRLREAGLMPGPCRLSLASSFRSACCPLTGRDADSGSPEWAMCPARFCGLPCGTCCPAPDSAGRRPRCWHPRRVRSGSRSPSAGVRTLVRRGGWALVPRGRAARLRNQLCHRE